MDVILCLYVNLCKKIGLVLPFIMDAILCLYVNLYNIKYIDQRVALLVTEKMLRE